MKRALLPFLNLDAATSLYLPLEPIEGRAQHRFAFRLPNGDEEWLLARLCVVQPDVNNEFFMHCVVLRPENAEESRIFVADNLYYRTARRKIEQWMTPAAAKRFKWDLFEQRLNNNNYSLGLSRYWKVEEDGKTTLLSLEADGNGEFAGFGASPEIPIESYVGDGFKWSKHSYRTPHEVIDLKFLRTKDVNFRRKIRAQWKNPNSEVRYTLRWMQLSDEQQDVIAFECRNGNWSDLQKMAALVLQVRTGAKADHSQGPLVWDFVAYGSIFVEGNSALRDDNALFLWRTVLTHTFKAVNVDGAGVKIDSLPSCLWNYIQDSERRDIKAVPLPASKLKGAKSKLELWTNSHFPSPIAQTLLNSFDHCSDETIAEVYQELKGSEGEV